MMFVVTLQLILEAKCHVVRDAQVVEKNKIKKELETEVQRLDHEMEVDRINAIKIEEEIARKRRNETMMGAMMIMDQIKHNQQVDL
jgi:Trichohyalin-plectin-homology domain